MQASLSEVLCSAHALMKAIDRQQDLWLLKALAGMCGLYSCMTTSSTDSMLALALACFHQAAAHASASQLGICYVAACQCHCKLPAAGSLPSRSKFHITVGHSTVMGETQFFGVPDGQGQPPAAALPALIKRVGQLATKVSSLGSCCCSGQVKPGHRQACSQGL